MFICLCHQLTLSQLVSQVNDGATTVKKVIQKSSSEDDCGSCHAKIARLIKELQTELDQPVQSKTG